MSGEEGVDKRPYPAAPPPHLPPINGRKAAPTSPKSTSPNASNLITTNTTSSIFPTPFTNLPQQGEQRTSNGAMSVVSNEEDRSTIRSRPTSAGRASIKRELLGGLSRKMRHSSSASTVPVPYGVTPDDLSRLVNFDRREGDHLAGQFELLSQAPFEGLAGLAQALRTHLKSGLELSTTTAAKRSNRQLEKTLSSGMLHGKTSSEEDVSDGAGRATNLLNVSDAVSRRAVFGSNVVNPPPSETILEIVWGTIKEDPIIKILIFGALITLIIGIATEPEHGWVEGLAIIAAVLIVLTVTAGNDYSKDKKFKKMLMLNSDKKTKVIRGGYRDLISSWDIMVGDIVEVAIGDEVPADGIFLRGNRLVVDESPLTGETIPVKKSTEVPFIFSGCQVSEGSGEILITSVGPRSTGGKIQELLSETQKNETALQMKLKDVAVIIGKIGLTAGVATFVALLIRWAIHLGDAGATWQWSKLISIVHFFVVGVTVIVVAVPEGLPLAVTISLAFSMFKMIKERCFVRHLAASETMGQATCVCTDKTGTLTENRMTVVKFSVADREYAGAGAGTQNDRIFTTDTVERNVRDILCENLCLNSSCFIKTSLTGKVTFVGSATEGALLVFSEKLGVEYNQQRKDVETVPEGSISFDSSRKRMTTTVKPKAPSPDGGDGYGTYRVYVKGASEIVLALSTHLLSVDPSGNPVVRFMEPSDRSKIESSIRSWAAEGLRTIAVSYRNTETRAEENPDHDLVYIGLLGIKDPVRSEVPLAVAQCQRAGIVVRMVTGDNILTASKIAQECGILNGAGIAMEGPAFRALTDEGRTAVIPRLQVLARSSPHDKLILVNTLKSMGEVVAVTGDGTNDAPALKEADVGFAMGISGTQIAMNACDIILLDDNFATIVSALRWGRNVLNCVRKFLQFQLSVNLVAIAITFLGSLTTGESPLSAVQLLWVNLIMDTLGALALASDEPEPDILLRKPHSRKDRMVTKHMQEYIIAQTSYQIVALLTVLFAGDHLVPGDQAVYGANNANSDASVKRVHTLVFTTFVFLQVTNEILARQLHHELNFLAGILRNRLFLFILFIILLVQCLLVQYATGFVQTLPLDWREWLVCTLIAAINFPWMFSIRACILLHRRYHRDRNDRVQPTAHLEYVKGGHNVGVNSKRNRSIHSSSYYP